MFQVMIMKKLKLRLQDKCSTNGATCPKNISVELFGERRFFWKGEHCIKYFGFIQGFRIQYNAMCPTCPCVQAKQNLINPEELFVLIDEYIEGDRYV